LQMRDMQKHQRLTEIPYACVQFRHCVPSEWR